MGLQCGRWRAPWQTWAVAYTARKGTIRIASVDSRQIGRFEWQKRHAGFQGLLIWRRPGGGEILDPVHTASLFEYSFKCWRMTQLFKNLMNVIDHLLRKMQVNSKCEQSCKVGFFRTKYIHTSVSPTPIFRCLYLN